jgi:hypothetical protein
MPTKRKGQKRKMKGKGIGSFFKNVGNAFKTAGNAVYGNVLKPVGNFVKDQKLISTGLSLIPDGRAQVASKVAGAVGLGKRRRKQHGRGVANGMYHPDIIGASVMKF